MLYPCRCVYVYCMYWYIHVCTCVVCLSIVKLCEKLCELKLHHFTTNSYSMLHNINVSPSLPPSLPLSLLPPPCSRQIRPPPSHHPTPHPSTLHPSHDNNTNYNFNSKGEEPTSHMTLLHLEPSLLRLVQNLANQNPG